MTDQTNILATAWYNSYDFGHDGNGNPTAHYELWASGDVVKRTKRRQQIGYSEYRNSDAEYELQRWAKRKFKQKAVWLFPDPMCHEWAFRDAQPNVARTNRLGSNNTHHILVLGCHPDEWVVSEEGIKRRLLGLVMPYIQQRIEHAKLAAFDFVGSADTKAIAALLGRFDCNITTITGLHHADIMMEAAWKKALETVIS